jgi:hypothetical protein
MSPEWAFRLFKDDALALETNAASARVALACIYSCSDEFEAEVIRAKRDAGVYGPRRQWRHAGYAVLMAAFGAGILAML